MKRKNRSSKQSAGEGSNQTGERATRSRTFSDDLFTIDLPRPSRSRRTLSAENKDTRNDDTKKRHHSGSKHRTRSHSGHNHLPDESSPAKVSRMGSTSKASSSKAIDKGSPEGINIEGSKKSSRSVPAKGAQNESHHKTAEMPESIRHVPRGGNPHSTRTRNHSGKNVSSKEPRGDHDQIRSTSQHERATRPVTSLIGCDSTKQMTPAIPQSPDIQQDIGRPKKNSSTNSSKLANPPLKRGPADSHNSPADIQGGSTLKMGTESAGENISNRGKISDSSDSKYKASATTSMQTALQVNHSETSPNSPVVAAKNKLEKGSQKRKRQKSSSRNLAPEFSNSLEGMSQKGPPKVTENSRIDGVVGNSEGKKELSPVNRANFPDATVPMEPSNGIVAGVDMATRTMSGGLSDGHEPRLSDVDIEKGSSQTRTTDPPPSERGGKQSLPSDKGKETSKQSSGHNLIDKSTHSVNKTVTNVSGDISLQRLHEQSTSDSVLNSSANSSSPSPGSISNLASTSTAPGPDSIVNTGKQGNPADTELDERIELLKKQNPQGDVGYQAPEWSQDVSESEPFYFESDHLALKGNKDYRMLLRTLTTLEAQRKQATQDLEVLVEKQKQALTNPIGFVNKIQHNVDLKLPVTQRMVPLPEVNWETYLGKPENSELLQTVANQKIKTRPSNSAPASSSQHNCLCCKKDGICTKTEQHSASTSGTSSTKAKTTDPKSQTHNLPWTSDEQRKLEELLTKYPMEAVEARRWEKVAKGLGNRTPLQVASRVQKYFIKLTRAGVPVPGRLPHSTQLVGRRGYRRGYSYMRPNIPSTFLQSVVPPVFMNDNDTWDSFDSFNDEEELSDDDSIPAELKETDEYKELKRLRQMKNEKMRQQAQMTHMGFQCDECGVEPIVGTRWHCSDCPSSTSTDLCQKCMDKDDYQSVLHTSSHHLEPIRFKMEATYIDSDYIRFQQQLGAYNYLDPNYTPLHKPEYDL